MKNPRAFTLIELLLASAIFAVASAGVYAALRSGLGAYSKMDAASRAYQESRILIRRVELDVSGAVPFKKDDSGFRGDSRTMVFYGVQEKFSMGASSRDYCRTGYSSSGKGVSRSSVCGVRAYENETGAPVEYGSGVSGIRFEYARGTGDPGQPLAWQEMWPASEGTLSKAQARELPAAVKVKAGGFEKTIPLLSPKERNG